MDDFCPHCEPGPHIPSDASDDVCALSLFELFFDDWAMKRIRSCTLAYAESKKLKQYNIFTRRSLTKEELMAFIGALVLLGINRVRNHRKTWSWDAFFTLCQQRKRSP